MDPIVGRFLLYLPIMALCIVAGAVIARALSVLFAWIAGKLWPIKQAKADLHESFKAKR